MLTVKKDKILLLWNIIILSITFIYAQSYKNIGNMSKQFLSSKCESEKKSKQMKKFPKELLAKALDKTLLRNLD